MGLFKQEVTIRMKNSDNIVEKQLIKITKGTVIISVETGQTAFFGAGPEIINGGQTRTYERKVLGDVLTVYVYKEGAKYDSVTFEFTAGQYTISLEELKGTQGVFSVNGTASVEIFKLEKLAKYFDRDVTKQDVLDEIEKSLKYSFAEEVKAIAAKYITVASTSRTIYQDVDLIKKEAINASAASSSKFYQMGLDLMPNAVTLKVIPLGETRELIAKINSTVSGSALDEIAERKDDKARQQRIEEKKIDNEHEINMIRAEHTNINENVTKVDNNGSTPVTINNNQTTQTTNKFCPECGSQVASDAKFCPNCGKKL